MTGPVTGPGTYVLERFPETLAVVRLGPGAEVPPWAESSSVFSVTATATETTLVCAARSVPTKARHHKPLTAFRIAGPLEPTPTGALAALLQPVAEAEIRAVILSTFDTGWLLVPTGEAERAEEEWRRRGHTVAPAVPVSPSPTNPERKSAR